jgi:hypothetical protein
MGGAFLSQISRLSIAAGVLALALSACGQAPSGGSADSGASVGTLNRTAAAASDDASSDGDGPIMDHFGPQDVATAFDALGLPYSIETDPRGYPMIVVDPRPFPVQQFNVLFFGCGSVDAKCEDISLWSWYDMKGAASQKAISAWNNPFKERRWSTAYLDDDGDPSLVLNINATGGIGERALQILVNTYLEDVFAFHDMITGAKSASNDADDDVPASASGFASSGVDPDVLEMTDLVKEYGGDAFAHTKAVNKKF